MDASTGCTPSAKPIKPFDLKKYSNTELIMELANPNKWFRQTAQRLLADRRDPQIVPTLKGLVKANGDQLALEAFWAINHSGGFTPSMRTRL